MAHLKIIWYQKHNGKISDGEIWFGCIDREAAQSFTEKLALILQDCYIDIANLNQIAKNNGLSAGDVLREQYLPDDVKVKIGDFGEILARSVIREKYHGLCFPVLRWRIKTHKNDTVRGVDLLGYSMASAVPTPKDKLVWCEVKTRTSKTNDGVKSAYQNVVQKIDVSRLANQLYFSQKKLLEQGLNDDAQKFARFSNPHKVSYTLLLMPCAVYESKFWRDTFLSPLPERHFDEYKSMEEIQIIIIAVENLASWIDEVYQSAVEQAGE